MVVIIKNAIANCYEIKKEKKKKERNSEIKGNRNQKGAKTLRNVAAFLSGAE